MRRGGITGQSAELKALDERSGSTEHLAKEQQTALEALTAEVEAAKSENTGESSVMYTRNPRPKPSTQNRACCAA